MTDERDREWVTERMRKIEREGGIRQRLQRQREQEDLEQAIEDEFGADEYHIWRVVAARAFDEGEPDETFLALALRRAEGDPDLTRKLYIQFVAHQWKVLLEDRQVEARLQEIDSYEPSDDLELIEQYTKAQAEWMAWLDHLMGRAGEGGDEEE